MRSFCLVGLLLWSAPAALARDIYVDNLAGDDRSTGELPSNTAATAGPVRTIAKATRLAGPGDRIVLAATDEPYRESVSLVGQRYSGSELTPFVLAGNGAILDGSLPVPGDRWQHFAGDVFRFAPERLGHQQLFLEGRPAVRRSTTKMMGSVPDLQPLEWSLTAGYIYFRTEPGKMPQEYNPAYAALQTGVTLYHVRGVVVLDLIVQGFQLDGINAFDGNADVRLLNVTTRGNGRSGITVAGSSRAEVLESLSGDNGGSQLRVEGYCHVQVGNTDLVGNTAPATVVNGGQLTIDGKPAGSSED